MRGDEKKKGARRYGSLLYFETLRYVKDGNQPLMRDIAQHFFITPSAATLLVDSLIQKKMLARVSDEQDRRTVRVRITKNGGDLLSRGMREKRNKFKKMFMTLDASERTQLIAILKKVAKSIG